MMRIILSLACIIAVTTEIFSKSMVNKNKNGFNYRIAAKVLHGNTKTKGPMSLKLDQRPYRIGTNGVAMYRASILKRHEQMHRDGTYHTPQGEISRHINQHEESDVIVNMVNVSRRFGRREEASQKCERHSLHVNFKAIGWAWIHSPKEINAFVCKGDCGNPIYEASAPYYAQVQARFNSLPPKKHSPFCCVPTKTSSLDVMYYLGRDKLTLNMPSIIVEECGCR